MIVAIDSEVLFECLVGTFSLSISFGMISGGEVKADTEEFAKSLEEVVNKFGAPIGSDMGGDSMLGKDMSDEELS